MKILIADATEKHRSELKENIIKLWRDVVIYDTDTLNKVVEYVFEEKFDLLILGDQLAEVTALTNFANQAVRYTNVIIFSAHNDDFSQDVIAAQIELLLKLSKRINKRQSLKRKVANNELLKKMEVILDNYLTSENLMTLGMPSVQNLSAQLSVSPSYLSVFLRTLISQNIQQHIQDKLIEKKSISSLSVAEIAYELSFEYSKSFSQLFKLCIHWKFYKTSYY